MVAALVGMVGVLPLEEVAVTDSPAETMERLWAPWRLEYIQSADEQPRLRLLHARPSLDDEEGLSSIADELAFVLLNKYPYACGHLMVAPYRHCGDLGELEPTRRRSRSTGSPQPPSASSRSR